MNFFSHRIANPTGEPVSFDKWVEDYLTKQAETKEAAEACPDEDGSRGSARCQNINTDNEDGAGYQKGESVTGKPDQKEGGGKKKADAKTNETVEAGKEMGKNDSAGKVTEEHGDASSTDPEVSQRINNDPNYQKGESTNPSKVTDKNKKESSSKFQKVASLKPQKKLQLFASMLPHYPKAYVEAMVGMKVANLDSKNKEFLRNFWLTLFPADYVDSMLEDR